MTKERLVPFVTGTTRCLIKDAKNIACPCLGLANFPSDINSNPPPSNSDSLDNKQVIDIFRTGGSLAQFTSESMCQS
jgi:hypothetical protein